MASRSNSNNNSNNRRNKRPRDDDLEPPLDPKVMEDLLRAILAAEHEGGPQLKEILTVCNALLTGQEQMQEELAAVHQQITALQQVPWRFFVVCFNSLQILVAEEDEKVISGLTKDQKVSVKF